MAKKDDDQTPATKGDLRAFATKADLHQFKEDIIDQFKLAVEIIRSDVGGANRDEIQGMKYDIEQLKVHTGFRAR